MKKILIAYFSGTGCVKSVTNELSKLFKIEKIEVDIMPIDKSNSNYNEDNIKL